MSQHLLLFCWAEWTNYLSQPKTWPRIPFLSPPCLFCMHTPHRIKIPGFEDHIERVFLIKSYTDLLNIQFKNVEFH